MNSGKPEYKCVQCRDTGRVQCPDYKQCGDEAWATGTHCMEADENCEIPCPTCERIAEIEQMITKRMSR